LIGIAQAAGGGTPLDLDACARKFLLDRPHERAMTESLFDVLAIVP
jgi:hypothetical protein